MLGEASILTLVMSAQTCLRCFSCGCAKLCVHAPLARRSARLGETLLRVACPLPMSATIVDGRRWLVQVESSFRFHEPRGQVACSGVYRRFHSLAELRSGIVCALGISRNLSSFRCLRQVGQYVCVMLAHASTHSQ